MNTYGILTLAIALCGIVVFQASARAQFNENIKRSLFSDQKAYLVGDAVTILIIEDTQADNSATTDESRDSDLELGNDLNGESTIDLGLNSGNSFSGSGRNTRREKIRAKLSAVVLEEQGNGNLKIEGTRTTTINGETQVITITGNVRISDIRPDNSVFSYHISGMTLTYEGNGNITEAQEPGLISKFLRFLF